MNHRIIVTICKHIVAKKTCSCTGQAVRSDESADGGIVVTALEVVEPGFSGGAVAVLIFTGIL